MKKIISLIVLCFLNFSCKKNIEVDKNKIFIRGGIKSEFVILKVKNNNSDKNISFPSNYSVKEKARLKIEGNGITFNYENGEKKYSLDGKLIELKNELNFRSKNEYYHWILEKPIDNKKHEIFPMKFENDFWYSIRDINFKGSNCYFEFYINKKGEFEYDDIGYINLSPI